MSEQETEGSRAEDSSASPTVVNEAGGDDGMEERRAPGEEETKEGESAVPEGDQESLVAPLEAVLFSSPEPITPAQIARLLGEGVSVKTVREAARILQERTASPGRGIRLEEIAGGFIFLTREEHADIIQRLGRAQKKERLSPAALETLAVVAYKQPVTRAEVDAIRGVASGPILRTLIDLKLVKVTGRAGIPGAPFQYGTTKRFLTHFGLRSTRDLPHPKDIARMLSEREGLE